MLSEQGRALTAYTYSLHIVHSLCMQLYSILPEAGQKNGNHKSDRIKAETIIINLPTTVILTWSSRMFELRRISNILL